MLEVLGIGEEGRGTSSASCLKSVQIPVHLRMPALLLDGTAAACLPARILSRDVIIPKSGGGTDPLRCPCSNFRLEQRAEIQRGL